MSDADGCCSASELYMYLRDTMKYNKMYYILNKGKNHGLSNEINNIILDQIKEHNNSNGTLVVLPDAGTNDVLMMRKLQSIAQDIKFLILDHHQKEVILDKNNKEVSYDNDETIVAVNNQMSEDYPNKALCGAGIVYKFLQALDDELWETGADEYLDLVAWANISDSMDLASIETKHLVNKGLHNIKHPLLKAFLEAQSYSVSNIDIPTVTDISWSITPLVNAMIRTGEEEDKELMFRAFIKDESETFIYEPKRASKNNPNKEPIEENIYEYVVRLCKSNKSKHDRVRQKSMKAVIDKYGEYNRDNKIFMADINGLVDKNMTGVVAMKIADQFSKPCLLFKLNTYETNAEQTILSGSGRNIRNCYIENLKSELNESKLFYKLVGHENAFGVFINNKNIKKAKEYFNEKYKDIDTSVKRYNVDFILQNSITYQTLKEINKLKTITPFQEPWIAIENIEIDMEFINKWETTVKSTGKVRNHWKIQIGEVEFIKFNVGDNDKIYNMEEFDWDGNENSNVAINCIGKVNINTYGGNVTPQFVIENYQIVNGKTYDI